MGSRSRTIGIYLYPDVEALDFAGPFEVFTTANRLFQRNNLVDDPPFKVFSVAESASQVIVRAGSRVEPDFTIGDHPKIELLLVPGGVVSEELKKPHVLDWILQCASHAEVTASICTFRLIRLISHITCHPRVGDPCSAISLCYGLLGLR